MAVCKILQKKKMIAKRLRENFASSKCCVFAKKTALIIMAFIYLGKLFALQQCTMEHFFYDVAFSFSCSFEILKQKISKIIQKISIVLS